MDTLFEEYGLALIECILRLAICSVLFGFVMKDNSTGEKKDSWCHANNSRSYPRGRRLIEYARII